MTTLNSTLAADRRGLILRTLHDNGEYALNEGVLKDALDQYAHHVGIDIVRDDLTWLAEHDLVQLNEVGKLLIATLTQRGADVAEGRSRCPGVKRPGPR